MRGKWGSSTKALVALLFALTSCADNAPNALDPKGAGATKIAGLTYLLLWISIAVFAVVLIWLVVGIVRGRHGSNEVKRTESRWSEPLIVVTGVVIPAAILGAVFVVSVRDQQALSQHRESGAMTIDVVGHLWWWEARYPNGAVTANEIHIPVGTEVRLRLTTSDVIHSFWVPQLQAKTDLINGHPNYMWLEADEPGRYRGQCAEFCGLEHAQMIFYVVADEPAAFQSWLAREAADAAPPRGAAATHGAEVFAGESCAGCHAIRGTTSSGTLGPDLTHLASRGTIAAGVLTNTPDQLSDWILHPQSIKPGVVMPPTDLSPSEVADVVAYLEQLD